MHRVVSWMVLAWVVAYGGGLSQAPVVMAEELDVEGEIVDPAGYLKTGAHGPDAVDQSYLALDGGQSLALLDSATQTLYLLLAEEAGEDPNELAYDYVNQTVRAKGTVYERNGVHGIVLTAAEPLEGTGMGVPLDGSPDLALPELQPE